MLVKAHLLMHVALEKEKEKHSQATNFLDEIQCLLISAVRVAGGLSHDDASMCLETAGKADAGIIATVAVVRPERDHHRYHHAHVRVHIGVRCDPAHV